MMCAVRVLLISSIIAASVVLLPLPVVPVTRISPRSSAAIVLSTSGSARSSMVADFIGMTRKLMPIVPRCWKALHRNRPRPATLYAEIDLVLLLEFLAKRRGQDGGRNGHDFLVIEPPVGQGRDELPAHPQHGIAADFQMEVRSSALDRDLQEVVDVHPDDFIGALALLMQSRPPSPHGRRRTGPAG